MRLFAYGTLEDPDLLRALTGRRFASERAVLEGYARFAVRGAPYPGIIASDGCRTPGTLYSGLDGGCLARLDRYEGALYERREVTVRARSGPCAAVAYVVHPARAHRLSTEPWPPPAGRLPARGFRGKLGRVLEEELPHMSVGGEFRRSIGNYLEFLGALGSPQARERADRLRAARARAETDLSRAAELVLDACDGAARVAPPPSATADGGDPERELAEHLVAISRVVVGR